MTRMTIHDSGSYFLCLDFYTIFSCFSLFHSAEFLRGLRRARHGANEHGSQRDCLGFRIVFISLTIYFTFGAEGGRLAASRDI